MQRDVPAQVGVGAVAGIGGYKYYEGELAVVYQAPYEKTWDASIRALEEMGYSIEEKTEKLGSGKIRTAEDHNKVVKMSLNYMSRDETEVKIRVGLLGDENASNVIKDKIGNILFNQ